jgi:hypothetical protein
MYDPNFPPSPVPSPVPPPAPPYPQYPQPPKPGASWPPFMGMLSILTVVFPFIFLCIFCLIFYSIGSRVGFETDLLSETDLLNMGLGTIGLVCASVVVSVVGVIIGLGALFGKTANKVLGLIGLGLNGFMLLAVCCVFLILLL